MNIQLKTQGGFAFLPTLQKSIVMDTSKLPQEQQKELEHLVQQSDFFHLPSLFPPPSQAADYQTYILTIEQEAVTHSVQFTELTANSALQTLRIYLQKTK